MKILVVDDNNDDRKVLRYVLEAHGHEVIEAVNGVEGLQATSAYGFDLVLSDVMMPVMDGFQFLRNLRVSSSVPFIFYSAVYDSSNDMQLATSLGVNGYIIKPKSPIELMEEIERIVCAEQKEKSGVIEGDAQYLKRYSQVVVSKLEEKVRALEEALAERKKMEQRLSDMTVELSLAEERERRRIAAELHDNIGQTLLLGKIKLGSLIRAIPAGIDKNEYEEILTLQEQVIRAVRSLTQQLSPPILSGAGLEAALEWLGKRMDDDFGLQVTFVDDRKPKPLSEDIRAIVFQACRELLINVAKHAGTESARVTVGRECDMLYLTVEDSGRGFDPVKGAIGVSWDSGFGLFNIRERLKHLGGELMLESAPGQGTRVTLRVGLTVKNG